MIFALLLLLTLNAPQDSDPIKKAEELAAENKYDDALAALSEAEKAAIKAKDTDAVLLIREQKKDMNALKKEYDKVKDAEGKLAANADDAEANMLMGRFYCFVRDDWMRGLPLLAKGADVFLKALAEMELTKSAKGEDKVVIGDGWWTGSTEVEAKMGLTGATGTARIAVDKDTTKRVRTKMKSRAVYWYQQSWPLLQDADREKIRPKMNTVFQNTTGKDRWGAAKDWAAFEPTSKVGLSETCAHSGKTSFTIVPNGKGNTITLSPPVRLIPGKEYELSCWYLSSGTEASEGLTMYEKDAQGGLFQPVAKIEADSPFWSRASAKFTVPAGISTISVRIITSSKKGQIWIDDVSLKCEGKELIPNGSFEK
ncbi:MAG TPA: carbohydrate binding domain-containing protein [Planctomycetota bacterium]|nr:carbohydrate binding domain-containing protein [Planctomycetota bacterium]